MPYTPFKLNLFLLRKIPIAFLAGIRVKELSEKKVSISVKHAWLNQNPFRSIYFGVLVMAGELSTGIPLFLFLKNNNFNMSMLVVEHHSSFHKKATGRIYFSFDQFDKIERYVNQALTTGEATRFDLTVKGINSKSEVIGEFTYTWSIKKRSGN